MEETTRPSRATRESERDEADAPHQADRAPTTDEERLAEQHRASPEVSEHERDMAERGADQPGEGRIP